MRSSDNWLCRRIAAGLVVWLTLPAGQLGTACAQQAVVEPRMATASPPDRAGLKAAVDSATSQNALPDNPEPASQHSAPQPLAADQFAQTATPPSDGSQQQKEPSRPLGTAAAPYEKTMGIAASRPAGAAIAPAKQKRVRTILISAAVIVGAGVAIGTVAGLSKGSASRPQ